MKNHLIATLLFFVFASIGFWACDPGYTCENLVINHTDQRIVLLLRDSFNSFGVNLQLVIPPGKDTVVATDGGLGRAPQDCGGCSGFLLTQVITQARADNGKRLIKDMKNPENWSSDLKTKRFGNSSLKCTFEINNEDLQ